jgi:hypothetical protein
MSAARLLRRLRSETGSVLVTSMILLGAMSSMAFGTYVLVDAEQRGSARDRTHESSFNLAEAALSGQVFILSRNWPGVSGQAYPTWCSQATGGERCPDNQMLTKWYSGADFGAGVAWTTSIRDNGGAAADFYSDAVTAGQPPWDANADKKMWVRAQALVRGKRRTMVGLVRAEQVTEQLPRNAITAGKFGTTNNGNKTIVDTAGRAAQSAPVAVRCGQAAPSSCMDYDPDKNQVNPPNTTLNYSGGNALSDEAIERLRQSAIANGSYYATGCPANPSGTIVFIENGNCAYNNSAGPCCNSVASPGLLFINTGTLSLDGNIVFHGIVYAANRQNSSGWVVNLTGTTAIEGSAIVDGNGGIMAGSSAVNLVFDPLIFSKVVSLSGAGIIQNTWREIPGA